MSLNQNIPTNTKDAFENGKNATNEGHNPFRNRGLEYAELHNAWLDGFESRNK